MNLGKIKQGFRMQICHTYGKNSEKFFTIQAYYTPKRYRIYHDTNEFGIMVSDKLRGGWRIHRYIRRGLCIN